MKYWKNSSAKLMKSHQIKNSVSRAKIGSLRFYSSRAILQISHEIQFNSIRTVIFLLNCF